MLGADEIGYYPMPIDVPEEKVLWAQADHHEGRFDEHDLCTDTDADLRAFRRRLVRSLQIGELTEFGAFTEPLLFHNERRCDLHSSLGLSWRYIQMDCALGHGRIYASLPTCFLHGCRA